MFDKRITIFCGHYGSGKTNIAVNAAMELRKSYERVVLADLDIVNPYFRSADSAEDLCRLDIRLIAPQTANTNLDAPALPQEMYMLTDDKTARAVIDLGGDERGALAMGRLRDKIKAENDFDMLFVINRFRPLTQTREEILEVMAEVEWASGLNITGIVNNSNLGAETDAETVIGAMETAREVSEAKGVPLVATCAEKTVAEALLQKGIKAFALNLQKRPVD